MPSSKSSLRPYVYACAFVSYEVVSHEAHIKGLSSSFKAYLSNIRSLLLSAPPLPNPITTMPASRMDRLIKVLGGEENLPPKLPQPAGVTPQQQTDQDIQPIDDFLQEQPRSQGSEWWNATSKIAQPVPLSQSHTTSAAISSLGPMSYPFDPRKDEPAPLGLNFCPFIAITKLPYKFVKREFMQGIATAFFDEGKIWSREWDV